MVVDTASGLRIKAAARGPNNKTRSHTEGWMPCRGEQHMRISRITRTLRTHWLPVGGTIAVVIGIGLFASSQSSYNPRAHPIPAPPSARELAAQDAKNAKAAAAANAAYLAWTRKVDRDTARMEHQDERIAAQAARAHTSTTTTAPAQPQTTTQPATAPTTEGGGGGNAIGDPSSTDTGTATTGTSSGDPRRLRG